MSDNPTKPKRTEKRAEMEDRKLVEYARRFLASKPSGTMTAEELAADFAAQLRRGCHQDLLRLIERVRAGTPNEVTGKSALRTLATCLGDVEGIESWGLPDCACKKTDCVYCSTGMATTPAKR